MIVDIHVHLGSVRSFHPGIIGWVHVELEDLLGYMDKVGVDWVVALSLPENSDPYSRIISNEKLLNYVSDTTRIVPFCAIDPRGFKAGEKLEKLVKKGCKGLGEFKVMLPVKHEKIVSLLKVVDNLGLPVLFHMEDKKYFYDIQDLPYILEKFPDVIFVAHGPGWWKHISSQAPDEIYPKGPIVEEGKVQEIMRNYPNIYADISAYSGLNALKRDVNYAKKFLIEFQDRILYGSDFPCLSPSGTQFGLNREHIDFLTKLKLNEEVIEKILWKNASKILK